MAHSAKYRLTRTRGAPTSTRSAPTRAATLPLHASAQAGCTTNDRFAAPYPNRRTCAGGKVQRACLGRSDLVRWRHAARGQGSPARTQGDAHQGRLSSPGKAIARTMATLFVDLKILESEC